MIIRHNPVGTDEEILLWMLLSCMVSYLNIEDVDTPCFTSKPDAEQYRNAIIYVVGPRKTENFEIGPHIDAMLAG